jgi:hypothetical protein
VQQLLLLETREIMIYAKKRCFNHAVKGRLMMVIDELMMIAVDGRFDNGKGAAKLKSIAAFEMRESCVSLSFSLSSSSFCVSFR